MSRRLVWAVVASYLTAVLLTVGVALWAGSSIRESRAEAQRSIDDSARKWCALLTQLDDAYRQAPPTTPSGKNFAAAIHVLVGDFHC